jgi:hypothetical protein
VCNYKVCRTFYKCVLAKRTAYGRNVCVWKVRRARRHTEANTTHGTPQHRADMCSSPTLPAEIAATHIAGGRLAARSDGYSPDVVHDLCNHNAQVFVYPGVRVPYTQVLPGGSWCIFGKLLHDGEEHLLVVLDLRWHNAEHPDGGEKTAKDWR